MKKSIENELHEENLAMEEADYRLAKKQEFRARAITWLVVIAVVVSISSCVHAIMMDDPASAHSFIEDIDLSTIERI